jgi:hypothetical protein
MRLEGAGHSSYVGLGGGMITCDWSVDEEAFGEAGHLLYGIMPSFVA